MKSPFVFLFNRFHSEWGNCQNKMMSSCSVTTHCHHPALDLECLLGEWLASQRGRLSGGSLEECFRWDIFTACDGFQLMGGALLVSASYSSLSAAALRLPLRVIFLHQTTTAEILGSIMKTLLWPKFHSFPGWQQL